MIVALIPARGASKRLPRKNVLPFGGEPLLCRSIAAARTARLDRCVVSTDDAEIAEIAVRHGAEVLQRPADLASDTATTESVVRHAIEALGAGGRDDLLVTLQPTNPLRPPSLVSDALALMAEGGADSVVAVAKSHQKAGTVAGGWFVPGYPVGIRSQDLPETYFESGLVYVSRGAGVQAGEGLFGKRVRALVTDSLFAQDIDTALDFEITEFLFLKHRERFV
jgi:N-acylneuraminate cytidylyltransferase